MQILDDEEATAKEVSHAPLRRFGEPKEVSSLVAFLCTTAAAYITGQIICPDGIEQRCANKKMLMLSERSHRPVSPLVTLFLFGREVLSLIPAVIEQDI